MRFIAIDRPQYKFSAAHMTVFPDGSKERLHGHNYQLAARLYLRDASLAAMCDFAVIKDGLKAVCAELNERTLLALHNPFLRAFVEDTPAQGPPRVRLSHRDGEYLFPLADVALLPLDNISSERLAEHCHGLLASHLCRYLSAAAQDVVAALEVRVFELPGQGAGYRAALPDRGHRSP